MKEVTGGEHRPKEWPQKAVDGFCVKDGRNTAIEFLGDLYDGHPRLWMSTPAAKNFMGASFEELFIKTEKKMNRLCDLGYVVVYVWEADYANRKALQSVESISFVFSGKLEWKK